MNKLISRLVLIGVVAGWLLPPLRAVAAADDESALIATLQSPQSSIEQKDDACRQLKIIGTAKSVPALAALLPDELLSQSARLALETLQAPEAGQALRDALAKTSGLTKAGIIDSLGARRDREALAILISLLKDTDANIASFAAAALGRIGGPQALAALQSARAAAPPAIRPGVVDALLRCAEDLLASDARTAQSIYAGILDAEAALHHRIAAYRGLILAAGDKGADMAAEALAGTDHADHAKVEAALAAIRDIKGEAATRTIAAALPKAVPPVQAAIMEALQQRGDSAAAGVVAALLDSKDANVRRAAITTLGALGDATAAPLLASIASSATGAEQDAARSALALIRDPKVCDALLQRLPTVAPAIQAEYVRALAQRQDTQAVPSLLKMATGNDEATSILALKSLAALAGPANAADLTNLLLSAKTDAQRTAAEEALAAACGRADKPETLVAPIVSAIKPATAVAARCALLRVIGHLGGAEALQALRSALKDADATVADAAVRSMAEFATPDAADDLLVISKDSQRNTSQRVIALRGYWRLVGLATNRSLEDRQKLCEAGLAAAQRPEEKRLGLAELSKLAHPAALKLAQSLCADEALRSEAESAVIRIAAALSGSTPVEAKAALEQIARSASSEDVRAQARKSLDAISQYAGYILTWSAAGPYRQAGKKCKELFNIAFAPEKKNAAVDWKPLPPPADVNLFWQADLLGVAGGESCVVYARSYVWCPKAQKVKLDIGSDDGIKLWINGKLSHANNAQRALKAGNDHAQAALEQGWNEFLAKITQNNMGCGVCIRIRAADGAVIEGLKFAAERPQ